MVSNNRIFKHFNSQLGLAFAVIAISTFNYGFDNAGYATTQAMEPFQRQFGEYDEEAGKYSIPPEWLSLFNSLNYIGFGAGVIIGSLVSARWGRRWCMFVMSAWALVPAIMAVTSSSRDQILAARILNYIYIGMELAVVPVYQSEIMPAEIRGFAVGSYQFSLMTGSLLVNAVCRGTSTLSGNEAWKIPFGLFFIIPVIVMAMIFFIPESPRWLLTKNKPEEARIALGKLRGGVLTEAEIDEQFASLSYALDNEPEQGKYVELFQGKNLKRTAVVVLMNFFQQATGQAFASSYGAVFIRDIGTVNPFNMTLINSFINLCVSLLGLSLVDRHGRRPLLFIGAVWMFAAIVTMGSLGTITDPSIAVRTSIVAMLTVFAAGFVFSWAPLNYVVTTEIPALRLRDASQRTASLVNVVTSFLVNFSIPYLLSPKYAGLQSRVGFIFAGIILLAIVFCYFCVPECKGKSLEQIDRMFNQGVPLRSFGNYSSEDVTQDDAVKGAIKGDSAKVEVHEKISSV
ncbi:general substrate transporter [Stachybotrys elegans]|uniref:General substrate transporter n=1 Tax=Stachybotrys elegans TaxID=80388 RepID=A0A8K0WKK6_9HYPO|nr:general substrate transporter [Stachybotrys elegans]